MNTELSKLLADVKDQVLYLQELGLESLDADLPDIVPAEVKPRAAGVAPAGCGRGIRRWPKAPGGNAVWRRLEAGFPVVANAFTGEKNARPVKLTVISPGKSNGTGRIYANC